MSVRTEQKFETRRRLVEEASRLFATRGFGATPTVDIARAAGVSHGAVFVHFPSRDDLVLAVTSELGRAITDRLHELASRRTALRDVLTAHLECLEENEELYRQLLVEGLLLPAAFRTTWVGLQSAVSHHIAPAAEREIKAGKLKRAPVHLLFNTWIGLVHHYLLNRDLFVAKGSVLKRHGKALVDHYMALLAQ